MASFCLLHGAWHDGSCWDLVAAELTARGHEVLAPDLPLHDPAASHAERIRPALEALAGAADPVVIVGHSLGSGYVPGVLAARPGALEVHLCPGLGRLREGFPWPSTAEDGTCSWEQAAAVRALYPRLQPERAQALAARLRPMAPPPDRRPRTPPRERPPVVIVAEADELFEVEDEAAAVRDRLGVEPLRIPGGHLPMAEDPVGLAVLLDRIARERAPSRA